MLYRLFDDDANPKIKPSCHIAYFVVAGASLYNHFHIVIIHKHTIAADKQCCIESHREESEPIARVAKAEQATSQYLLSIVHVSIIHYLHVNIVFLFLAATTAIL